MKTPANIPADALITNNPDGSTSYVWDDENGSNTYTENIPNPAPVYHDPGAHCGYCHD